MFTKSLAKSPDLKVMHLTKIRDTVYEPAEDTFVFLDGLEKEISQHLVKGLVCEIGCGNGLGSG